MKISFIILFFFSVVACGAAPRDSGYADGGISPRPADVYYAKLPAQLDFAGERVPLEYPDVRQALAREVSITMFMHSRSLLTFRAMKRYFPIIEPILEEYGVPTDFKYLAMAESGLDPNAFSSARASGLWQFMTSAAKDFSVETGSNVDMRYNVEQSTVAAAKYLAAAYKRYGNWTMAAASYNLGLSGVSRRANSQGVDNYYDLFLPDETMRYVYRILAMKMVSADLSSYGFKLRGSDFLKPFENYTEVEISSTNINWNSFAAEHNTNYKVLRMLNPWIRSYEYANKGAKCYTVRIPNDNFRIKGY